MAANQYGVNLGEVFAQGEAIKKARADRQLAQQRNELASLRNSYAQNPNDEQLRKQLLIMDPEGMQQTADAVAQMDKNERERTQQRAVAMAKVARQALESDDPEKTWEELKADVPKSLQQRMGEYSPSKAKMMYYNGLSMAELAKNPDIKEFGSKEQKYQNGLLTGETTSANVLRDRAAIEKERIKQRGENGLKVADENYFARETARQFGGIVNPLTNEITGLNDNQAAAARDINANASRIYRESGGKLSRAEALRRAFQEQGGGKKLGISWQK